MRRASVATALLLALGGGAWAQAGPSAVALPPPTPSAPPSTGRIVVARPAVTPAAPSSRGTSTAAQSSTAAATAPLPPSSVSTPASVGGVPPTPAPASPGLPSPPSDTGVFPSQQGFGARVENELRPSPGLDAAQVADVQATLAAGGLYRGPIDGTLSGATRAAIRQFQELDRLPPTGSLDAETLARLQQGVRSGAVASNGATSTAGNRSVAEPFAATAIIVPGAVAGTTAATVTTPFSLARTQTPFPLVVPSTLSPTPPPGTLITP